MNTMLVNIEYFEEIIHKIDNITEIIEPSTFWGTFETISNICVNVVVVVGGVLGLLYYSKLREKQANAVFSYLTQLQVRIKILYVLYTTYKNQIMERFIPETKRRSEPDSTSSFIDKVITEFAQYASETLDFLKESQEQMPASEDWSNKYEILIEFLLDAEHLSIKTFYKWINDDAGKQREDYVTTHTKNLEKILHDIKTEQGKNIKKMFHSHNKTTPIQS